MEYKEALEQPDWLALPGYENILAALETIEINLEPSPNTRRFFRLVQLD